MAKDQNLILNPTKISGVCGRLMCCLMYEKDAYDGDIVSCCRKQQEVMDGDDMVRLKDLLDDHSGGDI
jgi:cell fate regulator YaaT (PSP1 superfamily)